MHLNPAPCIRVVISVAFVLCTNSIFAQPITEDQTMTLDVVELVQGKEVKGDKNFQLDYEGFRYWFSSADNKKKFQSAPRKFQIQLDGGCGRMGSLSGRGKTSLWAVHDKRVYVFASTGCRTGFLKSPEKLAERDDSKPEFHQEAIDRGKALFQKVVQFCGGAKNIDSIKNYQSSFFEKVKSGDKTYQHKSVKVYDFRNKRIRIVDQWDSQVYSSVVTPKHSFFDTAGKQRPMYHWAQREMQRNVRHDLIAILKARNQKNFLVGLTDKPGTRNKVSGLAVYVGGSRMDLRVNTLTGQVRSISYRARGPKSVYGIKTEYLSEYKEVSSKEVSGVKLPHRSSYRFADSPFGKPKEFEVSINQKLNESDFAFKKTK